MPHHIIMTTGATGMAFTSIEIHILHSIAYPYKISIQHVLKPPDSPKRAEFCRWVCRYTHLVVDAFFFSNEAWFHLDGYINMQNYAD